MGQVTAQVWASVSPRAKWGLPTAMGFGPWVCVLVPGSLAWKFLNSWVFRTEAGPADVDCRGTHCTNGDRGSDVGGSSRGMPRQRPRAGQLDCSQAPLQASPSPPFPGDPALPGCCVRSQVTPPPTLPGMRTDQLCQKNGTKATLWGPPDHPVARPPWCQPGASSQIRGCEAVMVAAAAIWGN